jgi:uncharacterized membrane protein SpoIIM required for sporulation
MSQQAFQERHGATWEETAQLVAQLYRGKLDGRTASFPERYRRVCQHLSLARHRRYGADLIEGLNHLALSGHNLLYSRRSKPFRGLAAFVASGFPGAVRREWRLLMLATLFFAGPLVAMDLAVHARPDLVYSVVDPATLAGMEEMYDPRSDHFLRERASDSDLAMFGFYIRNNVGIGFRTFAGGMLLGLGSAFFLLFNGLALGAIAGHIDHVGYGSTFYSFVIGHGAFEITAIVLSGQAGMMLGGAILAPGRRSRARALVEEARKASTIVYGLAGMLFFAAFLEAFWSSSSLVPGTAKLLVGATLWLLVLAYFALVGRGRGGAR